MYWLPTLFSGFQRSPAAQSLAKVGQPSRLSLPRLLVWFSWFAGQYFRVLAAIFR